MSRLDIYNVITKKIESIDINLFPLTMYNVELTWKINWPRLDHFKKVNLKIIYFENRKACSQFCPTKAVQRCFVEKKRAEKITKNKSE